ncbi:hypothetical protein BH18ACT1_BH18ACT1_03280 [soil metagenome]
MERRTVEAYERGAAAYVEHRRAHAPDQADHFAGTVASGALRADLGCGPGHSTPLLGEPVVALDAAYAMLAEVPGRAPAALRVQADLEALPFRRGSLAGAWACKCYQHLEADCLPEALAELHSALSVGSTVAITAFAGAGVHTTSEDDRFPGRLFTLWAPEDLADVVGGAGFDVTRLEVDDDGRDWRHVQLWARRARTLPDRVGRDLRLLVCGLNPSLFAADAGVPFARPGNRFWPAALASGVVERDRDPSHALHACGVGSTDLVKRATVGAAELTTDELLAGIERVERLCERLAPRAVCLLGVAGWRAAVDRSAPLGWQERRLGGSPVYLMPKPSGRNAHTSTDGLARHMRAATEP